MVKASTGRSRAGPAGLDNTALTPETPGRPPARARRPAPGAHPARPPQREPAMVRLLLALLLAIATLGPALAAPPPQADRLDVRDYGARCDGRSDDTAAINATLARARLPGPGGQIGARIVFPSGSVCRITATLNATGLRGFSTEIDGAGATIDCEVQGGPCLDAIFSRFLHLQHLTITANGKSVPTIGLQIGGAAETGPSAGVSDCDEIDDLTLQGHFSLTGVYARGPETSLWKHLLAWNNFPGGTAYDLVLDGYNHFGVTSRFQTVNLPRDKPGSFQENTFITPDLRRTGPGAAIWMGSTMRARFLGGYIGNNTAPGTTVEGIVLYGANTLPVFDIHFEAYPNLADAILVTAPPGQRAVTIDGLELRDNLFEGVGAVFKADPALTAGVTLTNVRIQLGGMMHSKKVFDDPARWTVAGTYRLQAQAAATWNLPPSHFSGTGNIGTSTVFAGAAAGLRLVPGTPASAHAACTPGQIGVDASYVYVCTAPDTWKRAALAGF